MGFERRLRRTIQGIETPSMQAKRYQEASKHREEKAERAKRLALPEAERIALVIDLDLDILSVMEEAHNALDADGKLLANIHFLYGEKKPIGPWRWTSHSTYDGTPRKHSSLDAALKVAALDDARNHGKTGELKLPSDETFTLNPNLYIVDVKIFRNWKLGVSHRAYHPDTGSASLDHEDVFPETILGLRVDVRNGWATAYSEFLDGEHSFIANSRQDLEAGIIELIQHRRKTGVNQTQFDRLATIMSRPS